jgi:hypothetical protein
MVFTMIEVPQFFFTCGEVDPGSHGVQELDAGPEKKLAGHVSHDVAPWPEKLPAAQSLHELPELNCPAGHATTQ